MPAVLFDLDDTLTQHSSASNIALAATLSTRIGIGTRHAVREIEARWRELEDEYFQRHLAGALTYENHRLGRAKEFMAEYGVRLNDEAARKWYADYARRYLASLQVYPEVGATLDILDDGMKHVSRGIVTNGDRHFQRLKLARMNLTSRFDDVLTSAEAGVAKPDGLIFDIALGRLDVTAKEAYYVGDRLATDAIAAAKAGLTGIWLNRGGMALEEANRAEAKRWGVLEIESLRDLTQIV